MLFIIFILLLLLFAIFRRSQTADDGVKRIIVLTVGIIGEIFFLVVSPLFYLCSIDAPINDCCLDTATFSPESKLTIYVLIALSVAGYYAAAYIKKMLPPILEIGLSTILTIGFILSIVIHIHIFKDWAIIASIFCLPITAFFIGALKRRHTIQVDYLKENEIEPSIWYESVAWYILCSSGKYVFFIILCFPVLFLIASALLLFGQKPDAMIRAFTDTYRHTFSQLDYMCENVECGGHYLCSVAANGHKNVVKPIRYGERLERPIICNRQLLVSNAFEELVWQKMPRLHKLIRKNYDKVGDVVHKYYSVFNNKYVSDIVYILMKPLEWIFLFTLYFFDKNPENRIAKQYLKKEDKESIKQLITNH